MIRKGQRREHRRQVLGTNAGSGDPVHVRGRIQIHVIPAKSVNGNQQQVRLIEMLTGIDTASARGHVLGFRIRTATG